jgi:membrane fusion protein (multidrug efflux system)
VTPREPLTRFLLLPVVALALAVLAACGNKDEAKPPGGGAPGGGAPPPPQVGVITVMPQTVALQTELPGRVEPLRVAQVRARVTGIVLKRLFEEGSDVKAGQALFKIDDGTLRAAVDSATAQLARAEATAAQARATAERFRPLAEAKAIPQQDYVNAAAAQKAAEADVANARAALQTARINLGYATVTAPIAGRIGRALVTEGALVSAVEATQLAQIQQINTVYVNFTQSSAELLQLRRAMQSKEVRRVGSDTIPVHVLLEDGSELQSTGRLLFSDLSVEPSSGQVTLRAQVPNPQGLLLPGQYVRVRLAQAELPRGFLVPQQAVTRGGKGDTVLVVGADNKPMPRVVTISSSLGTDWVVTGGLQQGDRVIVDGFQKMFAPGAPVTPVPWQPASAASAGSAPQGAGSGPQGAGSAPAAAASR